MPALPPLEREPRVRLCDDPRVRSATVVLLLSLAACRDKAPACPAVAAHVLEMFGLADPYAREVRDVFQTRCTEDAWSAAMRTCVHQTRSLQEPKSCKDKLSAEHRARLEADLAAVEQRDDVRTIPPSCLQFEQVVNQLQSCTKLTAEVRAGLAKRLAESKAEWAKPTSKAGLGPRCDAAIYTLKPIVEDCATP